MRYGIRYSFRLAGTTGHGAISKCLGYMTPADRFFFLDLAFQSGKGAEEVSSWIRTLYDQALIAEGSPLEDPADFARRLTLLVQKASAASA